MRITSEGYAEGASYFASPNCDERPADARIELIVIHSISLPPGEFGGPGIIDLFLNRLQPEAHPYYPGIAQLRVSAHFLIRRDGAVLQFVSCARRAWHAGVSNWRGRSRCNDFSVGIELEGADNTPYEDAQYRCLRVLIASLQNVYPIVDITGHADIAPGRKTDPGPAFDWSKIK
jgi:AmpD protein